MCAMIRWTPDAGYVPATLRSVDELFRAFFGPLHGDFSPEMMLDSGCALKMEVEAGEKEVKAILPVAGCKSGDFDIEVQGDALTVRVRRTFQDESDENSRYLRRERSSEEYEESVKLPCAVKAGEASAKYVDGVLTITLPRAEDPKPRTKQIKVA